MDFISASAGGLTFHLGRDMKTSHKGMGIDQDDYTALKKHLVAESRPGQKHWKLRNPIMPNPASTVVGVVEELWRYPVKSMIGEQLTATAVTESGLLGDRAYALRDTIRRQDRNREESAEMAESVSTTGLHLLALQ